MTPSEKGVRPGWLGLRIRSFRYAFRGIRWLMREPNARVHAVAALLALAISAAVRLSPVEWSLVVLAIVLVFTAEALNTALERLADAAVPNEHPLVGAAKDLGAGAVLVASLGAAVIGLLVLGPHLCALVCAR